MAIIKNGFKFHNIPLERWNSNDYCLAYHELPHEQTTVEFSGSWYDAGGRHFDKFRAEFFINVENSSSKWVSINGVNYFYEATVGTHYTRAGSFSPTSGPIDQYGLLSLFNSNGDFDLSQLTLTSPDRLDAKGTYYINWQTYQFQNNGEQLFKDAIKSESQYFNNKDLLMELIGLLLRGLRTLGIEEWLPGDIKKSNIEIKDENETNPGWRPLRHNACLYLDNKHANINYCKYNEDVFYQTDNYQLY